MGLPSFSLRPGRGALRGAFSSTILLNFVTAQEPPMPPAANCAVGDAVLAQYGAVRIDDLTATTANHYAGAWFHATITRVDCENGFDISWQDGSTDRNTGKQPWMLLKGDALTLGIFFDFLDFLTDRFFFFSWLDKIPVLFRFIVFV